MSVERIRQETIQRLKQDIAERVRSESATAMSEMPGTEGGEQYQFGLEVVRLFERWCESPDLCDKSRPGALVLSHPVPIAEAGADLLPIHHLPDRVDPPLSGRIVFVTPNLRRGRALVLDMTDPNATALDVLAQAIEDGGWSDKPHALLDPSNQQVIICPEGSEGPRLSFTYQELHTTTIKMDYAALEGQLEAFHAEFTRFPESILIPWKNAKARILVDNLERRISYMLAFVLGKDRAPLSVTVEHFMPEGRADVVLQATVMASGLGACVLELKVLRAKTGDPNHPKAVSDWYNLRAACKGVIQCRDYRARVHAGRGYLLCFDARESAEPVARLAEFAATHDVHDRRYRMYTSTDEARDEELALLSEDG